MDWQPLDDDAPPREPEGAYRPPGEPAPPAHQKFSLEPWRDIAFVVFSEWLIKQFLPLQGLAAIFGKPGSFKSFVALHIALCIALGRPWGRRRVAQRSVVYIAAEGSAGLRKRKAGYQVAQPDLPADPPSRSYPPRRISEPIRATFPRWSRRSRRRTSSRG